MTKEKYEKAELNIIGFQIEDVIMASPPGNNDESKYETSRF